MNSILYRVYWNSGTGGPVDFSTPLATVSSSNFQVGSLAAPSDCTFVIRSYDPITALEDANSDARLRVVIDETGRDVTSIPDVPQNVWVSPRFGGGYLVGWIYRPKEGRGLADAFRIEVTTPGVSGNILKVLTVPRDIRQPAQVCLIDADIPVGDYEVTVKATNSMGSSGASESLDCRLGGDASSLMMEGVTVSLGDSPAR